jgi:hypothetical protein
MKSGRVLAAAFAATCVAAPSIVRAQVPQPSSELLPRPYSGLYGGNEANTAGVSHLFDATLSLWGGNDDNTVRQPFSDPTQSIGGPYSAGAAAFSYAWRGQNLAIGANATSQSRYYADVSDFLAGIHAGGVGFEASLGSKTRIQAQQSIAFSPLFAVNPFPVLGTPDLGEIEPPNADYTLAQRDSLLVDTTAGFSRVLDGRTSVGAGYVYSSSTFSGNVTDLRSHSAVATLDRRVGRNTLLGARYTFQNAEYELNGAPEPVRTHQVAMAFGQQWVHSRTRRSTVQASLGAVVINDSLQQTRPVGSVQFTSMIGQSWDLMGSYERGTQLTAGLTDVTYVDTLGFGVRGLLTRRIDVGLSASYASGEVGFDELRNSYTAYTAVARVGFAMHRSIALFGEAFYYSDSYNLGPDPGTVGPGQDRERTGFRAGLSWWVPIVRERRPSGTR